jgi:hypothetical protein
MQMTTSSIGRALFCLFLGVALLASVVAFVPGPLQVLAALIILPFESILLAYATAPRRPANERTAIQLG